ncbi:topiosmerase [Jeotgalicoccus coquinae]|uniref:Ribonuclease M5 n=1 Tax=Jeotgalicoccus coquinae TaxID=709509 RepID=A0A6V7RKZ9_9STAP|nr:toprim domain-containing protein [Jeotgalicoccus coquinae]MBB6422323.1 toprim domain protein [Jeotgalicoccus coquinae]GGE16806.1 topiosmerase [Jeotgalicoccus coquinae]CAD2078932.1 Ribonuclease M5 [Jeotgalicoccus coquinae]
MNLSDKVLIVEGKTDKRRLEEVLVEPVQIICTFGTMGISKLDEIIEQLGDSQIFILSDADKEGRKIRKWFKKYISESTHIYIDPKFGEVGRCPHDYLANLLLRHGFYVDTSLIMKGKLYRDGNNFDGRYIKEHTG